VQCRRGAGRQPALHAIVRDTPSVLHVTNGDSAVERLRDAGVDGGVLPWRDALHEGPVPAGLDPAQLRVERARFIAASGWADETAALAALTARDERLDRAIAAREEIVLWFESDLYDILQLAQIADRLDGHPATIVLVGTDRFRGVVELSDDEILAARPQPFDPVPYRALWDAFRAPDPRALAELDGPPVVRDAAHRHLQQFPWTTDGLSRSERALLRARADGARTPAEAFLAAQRQEERPFLGDAIAFDYLERLDHGDRQERWLGGARAGDWRYDPATGTVV
jgi:Domain of unknown function (DUF1835)